MLNRSGYHLSEHALAHTYQKVKGHQYFILLHSCKFYLAFFLAFQERIVFFENAQASTFFVKKSDWLSSFLAFANRFSFCLIGLPTKQLVGMDAVSGCLALFFIFLFPSPVKFMDSLFMTEYCHEYETCI
jgi:hypothetical protein